MAATVQALFRYREDDKTSYLNRQNRDIIEPGIWFKSLVYPTISPSLFVRIGDPDNPVLSEHRGVVVSRDGTRVEIFGTIEDSDSFASLAFSPGDSVYPRFDLVVMKYKHEEIVPAPVPQFLVKTGSTAGGMNPLDPELDLEDDEVVLAKIRVNPNASQITEEDIFWVRENSTGEKLEKHFGDTNFTLYGNFIIGPAPELEITPGPGLSILIDPGTALIEGLAYENFVQRQKTVVARRTMLLTGAGPNLTINPTTPIKFPTQIHLNLQNLDPDTKVGYLEVRGTGLDNMPLTENIPISVGPLASDVTFTTANIFKTVDNNGLDVFFPLVPLPTQQTQVVVRIKDRPINKVWAIGHNSREMNFIVVATQEIPDHAMLIGRAVSTETGIESYETIRDGYIPGDINDLQVRMNQVELDISNLQADVLTLQIEQAKLKNRKINNVPWPDVANPNINLLAGSGIQIIPSPGSSEITIVNTGLTSPGSLDHGGLSGLGDNDHPQYLLVDGSSILNHLRLTPSATPINPPGIRTLYILSADNLVHYWNGFTDTILGAGGGGGGGPSEGPATKYLEVAFNDLIEPTTIGSQGRAQGRQSFPGTGGSRINFEPFIVPGNYVPGTDMFLQMALIPQGTSGGDARFELIYDHKGTAVNQDGLYDDETVAQIVPIPAVFDQQVVVTGVTLKIPAAHLSPGKIISMSLRRTGSDIADTNTDAVVLFAAAISYTEAIGGGAGGGGIQSVFVISTAEDAKRNELLETVSFFAREFEDGVNPGTLQRVGPVQFLQLPPNPAPNSNHHLPEWPVPDDYRDGTPIKVVIKYFTSSAVIANHKLRFSYSAFNEGSAVGVGHDNILDHVFTLPGAGNQIRTVEAFTIPGTGIVNGTVLASMITRLSQDAQDTSADNFRLVSISFRYKEGQ